MAALFVANRWDGLGGRLNAIINGISMARACGARFAFHWPMAGDGKIGHFSDLFSTEFLSRFHLSHAALADMRKVAVDPASITIAEAGDAISRLPSGSYVDMSAEPFAIVSFRDEIPDEAELRFRTAFGEIDFIPPLRSAIAHFIRLASREPYVAVHVRRGDIVTGEWRQYTNPHKYTATPFLDLAVQSLFEKHKCRVVIASDDPHYLSILKTRHEFVASVPELFKPYDGLTNLQRAFVEIVALANGRLIVAPPWSAFSRLAASIGGVGVVPADKMPPGDDRFRILLEGVNKGIADAAMDAMLKPAVARDICLLLDEPPGDFGLDKRRELADIAVKLEPDFCGALTRSARLSAEAGDLQSALIAANRALQIANDETIQDDPRVEALSTRIAIGCLGLFHQIGNPQSPVSGIGDQIRLLRQMLADCERQVPYQIPVHNQLLDNLRYQVAAIDALTGSEAAFQTTPGASIWDEVMEDIVRRDFGYVESDRVEVDALLRFLEQVSIRLAVAHAYRYRLHAQNRGWPQAVGCLEQISESPTGLMWMSGWAWCKEPRKPARAVVLWNGARPVAGGPVYASRDDVAAHFCDEKLAKCGFLFPVPRKYRFPLRSSRHRALVYMQECIGEL